MGKGNGGAWGGPWLKGASESVGPILGPQDPGGRFVESAATLVGWPSRLAISWEGGFAAAGSASANSRE